MGKGSKIISFRISDEMLRDCEELAASRNFHTKDAPWTRTDFILKAIADKIAHAKRSRSQKQKPPPG